METLVMEKQDNAQVTGSTQAPISISPAYPACVHILPSYPQSPKFVTRIVIHTEAKRIFQT